MPPIISVSDRANFQIAAASEAIATPPPAPLKPGILIVTLYEGKRFSLPAGAEHAFTSGHHQGSLSTGGGFSVAGSMRPNSSSRNQGGVVGSYASNRPQSAAGSINSVPTIHGRYSSKYLPYALVDFDKQQVFINAVQGTPENPLWAGGNTQYKFDVSRMTDLTISLYIRNPSAAANAGRNDDIFIGTCKVNPRFEEQQPYVEDQKLSKKDKEKAAIAHAESERGKAQAGADWIDIQYGTGSMKIGVNFVENRQDKLTIEDFDLLKVVGKGSFGKVMQVQYVVRA
jgi:serum/glucocorticoid-regulated kinase 2